MFNPKTWATPLTIGAFLISGLTGILIFFHLTFGLVKPAHEWLSWFFVLGAGFHVWINWTAFAKHFSRRAGVGIISLFVLLTVLALIPFGGQSERRREPPFAKATNALTEAPLAAVATIAKNTPAAIVEKLKAKGLNVANDAASIKAIAQANNKNEMQVLGMIFE